MGERVTRQADRDLRARPQPLHDGREEFRGRQEEGGRSRDPGDAALDRRREVLQLCAQRCGRPAAGRSATAAGPGRSDDPGWRRGRQRAAADGAGQEVRPAHRGDRHHVVAGHQEVRGDASGSAQGRGPVGHQRARQSAPAPRDVQVRDARRGEPAADRARRVRSGREEGHEGADRPVQGSAARARHRAADQLAAREAGHRAALGLARRAIRSTSPARAATSSASIS